MPRKVFAVNEVLTASDVNEYFMDQTVMTFAGTAARGSAIGTAVEGMVTYLEDTDSFEYWDSSAWVPVVPDFDLTTPVSGDSLVYDGSNWVNGPRSHNAIINGDFGIWQRGTTTGAQTTGTHYLADRWFSQPGSGGASVTVTQESFSPTDIEAIGYGEGQYFLRFDQTTTGSGSTFQVFARQHIEDVRTFAGQQVTFSFWAKAASATTVQPAAVQVFGSGGSSNVFHAFGNANLTTSWQRFSFTRSLDDLSGKTIGAGSYLAANLAGISGELDSIKTVDIWGVQLEAGPVATPFTLAGGGSKAAELALCQRYYALLPDKGGNIQFPATRGGTNIINFSVPLPQSIRGDSPQASISTATVRGDGTEEVFTPSLFAVWGNVAMFQGTGLTLNPNGAQAYVVYIGVFIEVEDEL